MNMCVSIAVSAASWGVAVALAVAGTVVGEYSRVVWPWLLIALAIAVIAAVCLALERSRELTMRAVRDEFDCVPRTSDQRRLSSI